MAKLSLLIAAAALATASARCKDNCNLNGQCSTDDKCTCFPGFTGTSCSDRVCPFGNAWIGDHSAYVECSNKGSCDRKSGNCKCQDGFEGKSCNRMACPNDGCGGHGQCLTQNYFFTDANEWDQNMIQGCSCDPGYGGNGCEERLCPRGDDPMTEDTTPSQTQNIHIVASDSNAATALDTTDEFIIEFCVTHNNQCFTTYAINVATSTEITIKEALESLPDESVPSVDVTDVTSAHTSFFKTFALKFSNPFNSGAQNLVSIKTSQCTLHGCKTISEGTNTGGSLVTANIGTASGADAENAVCSNRGDCDTETGECTCNDGFKGQACSIQTTYV
jgi:hypothetical protein